MLFKLFYGLHIYYSGFNLFRYITFRTGLAVVTSFLIVVALGPWLIEQLKRMSIQEVIRSDGPEQHKTKAGTPTMGGILILGAMLVTTWLWAEPNNIYIWTVTLLCLGFGIIGLIDDVSKLKSKGKSHKGMSGKLKFLLQIVIGLAVILLMVRLNGYDLKFWVPFFKNIRPDIGLWYIPFALLVVVAASNAVNLTDGLDGLATGPVVVVAATYTVFAYISGRVDYTQYLNLPYVAGSSELCIFTGSIVGAGMGFLWFNSYPASVFMGDVGSLSLGSGIGAVAVITKQELALLIVGGIFVVEALSVILQVGFFKWKKQRIFLMAPIHHHFEKKGWPEPKVIVRFWIVQIILALVALSTIKLR
jgi:phospho-N-acetylmuramoyl-pentapeptide-transferase